MARRRKRFFADVIANKIKQDLINDNEDLDFVKTVMVGDLSLMPSPEEFNHKDVIQKYLPAVFIQPGMIYNVNATANKSVTASEYYFTLRYVHYYDKRTSKNYTMEAIQKGQLIADTLLEDHNMYDTSKINAPQYVTLIDESTGEEVGCILETDVPDINFNSVDTEFFNALTLPVVIVEITYCVTFRSFYRKGV